MRSSSSRSGTERGTRRRGAATRRALLALGAACLVGGASPEPPTQETQQLLSAIQSRWERVQRVRARFEQRSRVAALGSDEVSQGSVLVARPGRMRWEYEAPQPSVIVVDGDAVRIYSPADEQLQIAPLTREMLSPTALGFLLGESDLRETFHAERLDAPSGELRLRLVPVADSGFEYLELWLEAERYGLRGSVLVDLFGNRTELLFLEVGENIEVAADAFHICVPEGTEVIDLR